MEGHPDNVAACLLGGLTVAWTEDGAARAVRLQPVASLKPVVFVPATRATTAEVRRLLPDSVPHADAAANAGRAALMLAALTTRPDLLLPATVDWLHQPYRAPAMPETAEFVARLRAAGVPAVVSGAGPAVLALAQGPSGLPPPPSGWSALSLPVDRVGAQVRRPDGLQPVSICALASALRHSLARLGTAVRVARAQETRSFGRNVRRHIGDISATYRRLVARCHPGRYAQRAPAAPCGGRICSPSNPDVLPGPSSALAFSVRPLCRRLECVDRAVARRGSRSTSAPPRSGFAASASVRSLEARPVYHEPPPRSGGVTTRAAVCGRSSSPGARLLAGCTAIGKDPMSDSTDLLPLTAV